MKSKLALVLLLACRADDDALDLAEQAQAESAYTAPECPPEIDAAIRAAVKKYKLPRWFYYAVVHRESSFNPTRVNQSDNGLGLTQLTGLWYNGSPYPQNLAQPNPTNQTYIYNMRIQEWGQWINMNDVTPLIGDDWKDPTKNLDRYSSGYAAPMFHQLRKLYPNDPLMTTLRRLAFHWRYGVYTDDYPNDPAGYFPGQYAWDNYVSIYKPAVEAEDGVWDGIVAKPPYNTTTPPPASTSTVYEAEAMYHSIGGTTPGGWYLWDNGYISTQHTFTAGATTITVQAKGEQAGNAWPHMVVSVGGTVIGNANVNTTAYAAYSFPFTAAAGAKEVRVAFDNDYYDDATGADRNLLVDKVTIALGGTVPPPPPACAAATYEAEAMTHSTGGAATGGWNLWSNGYIARTHTFTTPTTLRVTARGESAGGVAPRMIVSVGGVVLGNVNVSATAYTQYSFAYTGIGSKEIRVAFDNDAMVGGQDRNLIVDKVAVACQ